MKIFSKIVFFAVICLFAREALANPYVMIYDNLDFGRVAVSDTSQEASFTLDINSGNITDIVRVSVSGQNRGLFRIHNDGSSQVRLWRVLTPKSGSSTTLTCIADCSGSCTITYRATLTNAGSNVSAGGRWGSYVGGKISIPRNCGSGTFTGTINVAVYNDNNYSQGTTKYDEKTMSMTLKLVDALKPIVVSKTQDMNFGQVSSNQSHDVTINPNGCSISSTYPAGIISASGAKCGIFTIKNEGASAQALTSVTLPSSVTLSGSNGGTMSLDITSYPAVSSITSVPASTTTSVYVGGTLHVLSSNVAGTYTGNYTITVNY